MQTCFYRITCLSNMHMGSGDSNDSVIDLEVERDPVLGEPTMYASGVKGALRDFCSEIAGDENAQEIHDIFGDAADKGKQGQYNFFSGDLLARPVRVSNGSAAYVLATTPDLVNHILRKLQAFGIFKALNPIPEINDGKIYSLASSERLQSVEGVAVTPYAGKEKVEGTLQALTGTKDLVIMGSKTLRDIALPVMTHNVLEDHISKNLWYEEVVPHESIFGLMIRGPQGGALSKYLCPGKDRCSVVQFGAGATTGDGFTRVELITEEGMTCE